MRNKKFGKNFIKNIANDTVDLLLDSGSSEIPATYIVAVRDVDDDFVAQVGILVIDDEESVSGPYRVSEEILESMGRRAARNTYVASNYDVEKVTLIGLVIAEVGHDLTRLWINSIDMGYESMAETSDLDGGELTFTKMKDGPCRIFGNGFRNEKKLIEIEEAALWN